MSNSKTLLLIVCTLLLQGCTSIYSDPRFQQAIQQKTGQISARVATEVQHKVLELIRQIGRYGTFGGCIWSIPRGECMLLNFKKVRKIKMNKKTQKGSWIKLPRNILFHEIFNKGNERKLRHLFLLIMADHPEMKWYGKTVQRGELCITYLGLFESLGYSVGRLHEYIQKLKSWKLCNYIKDDEDESIYQIFSEFKERLSLPPIIGPV